MFKRNKKLKHTLSQRKQTNHVANTHEVSSHQHLFQRALTFHQAGRLVEAEALYRRVLNLKPDYPEAHYNLGNALHGQGKLDEAVTSFRQALDLNPDYVEAYYNLGVALQDLVRLDEAATSYFKALTLKSDYAEAHHNLGSVFFSQGKLGKAVSSYRKAFTAKPEFALAYSNLGKALAAQGKLEEAVKFMQIAVEKAPADSQISDYLIVLLNKFMPSSEIDSPYIKAQESLQQVNREYLNTGMIADKTVRKLYQQCLSILTLNRLDIYTNKTQLYRGVIVEDNCQRHKMVFNTFKIIPEYCFNCFKVIIEPRTVMELFKLLFVFDKLKLPNDNPRKCIIEVRPKISGTYKGFIYCKGLNEGKEILNIVQPVIDEAIIKGIPVFLKRGCSEFQVAYPTYGHIPDNKIPQLSYNEKWRQYEAYADKNMQIEPFENPNNFSHNHAGFSLLDILVMRNWLAYAAKIGDLSYLKIIE